MPNTLLSNHQPDDGPMIVSKATIEREAQAAARQGQSLDHACPYPFHSPAGQHFKAAYRQALAEIAEAAQ